MKPDKKKPTPNIDSVETPTPPQHMDPSVAPDVTQEEARQNKTKQPKESAKKKPVKK
jgi:hypothetical protein